jgi:hypothetical protein
MKRLAALALFLAAATLSAAPCVTSPTRLCLNGGRFAVDVSWKDFQGNTGVGQAIPLTGDTGYFWFFSSSNVELVVKALDARALNGHFWVFYGALSNVEYTMTVTDSVTGSVKTYANPSGHFGSVGDTAAFSSTGKAVSARHASAREIESLTASTALALREALLPSHAQPLKAAAAGTCAATGTSLCLNNGRFRVEVAWKDFAGNTGLGIAVGLTGDTGYFWFFSSNNVELVVKVLDARTLNGRFWVFYGALSNVEYSMKVTDTLTGNVNTYSNPSGQFASTGDTDGFQSGFSVAMQLDESRAASNVIPASGGTLSATAADGTVFTLTVPDGALLSDETITMTPVAAIDRLPLSGGLAAAVSLSPEGLRLFKPANLAINLPTPIPADSEITFALRGSGEEFFLYPPDPLGTPAISLSLMHFSAYGAGRGSSADQAAQQGHPPANKDDQLAQNLQAPAADQRRARRNGQTPAQADATRVLTDYLNAVLLPSEPTTCSSDWKTYFAHLTWFQAQVLLLTGPNATLVDAARRSSERVFTLLVGCYDDAYGQCKSGDATKGEEMLRIYGALKSQSANDRVDRENISKCLTFELDFNSFVQEVQVPFAPFAFNHQLGAIVPGIIFSPFADDPHEILPAELHYVRAGFTGNVGDCSMTTSGSSSVFRVSKITIDLNVFEGKEEPDDLTVAYDPGAPQFTFTLSCPASPVVTLTQPRWLSVYEAHRRQPTGTLPFLAEDWLTVGLRTGLYAAKTYAVTDGLGQETTTMELRHTPQ